MDGPAETGAITGPWFTEPLDGVVGLPTGSVAVPYGEIIYPSICNGVGVGPGIVRGIGLRVGRRDGFFVGDLVTGVFVVGRSVLGDNDGVFVVGRSVSGDNDGDGVLKLTSIVGSAVGTLDGETVGSVVRLAVGTSVCGETTRPVMSNVPTETATYSNVSESSASK